MFSSNIIIINNNNRSQSYYDSSATCSSRYHTQERTLSMPTVPIWCSYCELYSRRCGTTLAVLAQSHGWQCSHLRWNTHCLSSICRRRKNIQISRVCAGERMDYRYLNKGLHRPVPIRQPRNESHIPSFIRIGIFRKAFRERDSNGT